MNSLLLTLTAVLILVLSALFAAPLFIDWNDYRSVFETQATNLLGRQVKVGGKVHLVLLPAPELKFDDIKVADQEGSLDRPFLESPLARGLAQYRRAAQRHRRGAQDRHRRPVLRLDLKADGTGNWSDVGRRGVALPFAPKDVLLDSVSVSGGRVEITKQGVPQLTLDDVSGEAERPVAVGSLQGIGQLQLRRPAAGAEILDQRSRMPPGCSASNLRCATSTATPPICSTAA